MTYQRRQRGFSLIEMVVVLALSSIAALIAVPRMSAFHAQFQLAGAANQLAFDIARARIQAIGQHKCVRILMTGTTQYVRQTSAATSATACSTTWTTAQTMTLPTGVTSAGSARQVCFGERGLATVNDAIAVSNSLSRTKTIATSLIGQPSIS